MRKCGVTAWYTGLEPGGVRPSLRRATKERPCLSIMRIRHRIIPAESRQLGQLGTAKPQQSDGDVGCHHAPLADPRIRRHSSLGVASYDRRLGFGAKYPDIVGSDLNKAAQHGLAWQ